MSLSTPMRRAGVLLAKAGTTSTSPIATTASSSAARSVTVEDAKTTTPSLTSTTETMMPWDGWFYRFLKSKLGDERFKTYRDFWTFRPDDEHNMEQTPRPSTKIQITDDGKTAMYRSTSPGSQTPANLPTYDKGHIREDPFYVAYYPTDTKRMNDDPALRSPEIEKLKLSMMDQDDPRVKEAQDALDAGPGSSPGNKGVFATGKSDYDPTGLRAAMSTNHAATHAELEKHLPTHLPTYEWAEREDEIIAWHEERGLPLPIGDTKAIAMPREGRIATW